MKVIFLGVTDIHEIHQCYVPIRMLGSVVQIVCTSSCVRQWEFSCTSKYV